ncbi:hypothetical protein [Streptomyces sp. NPDC020965]|uniref:hypothetical protein n=1 Tax=Streptomyces sp. NPDC020965 TaxID=3365105 RepID=UPI00378E0D4B
MTESADPRDSPDLDSAAQLVSRITAQLGSRLSHVRLDGTLRPVGPAAPPLHTTVTFTAAPPGDGDP